MMVRSRRFGLGTRRATCVVLVALVASVAGSGVAPAQDAAHANTCAGDTTGMELSSYPNADNGYPSLAAHGVIADKAVLDAFAREYANCPHRDATDGQLVTTAPDVQDFFLFWLPNRLYNIAAGVEAPPKGTERVLDLRTDGGLGRALWLSHLSGYYSGIWLQLNMGTPTSSELTDSNISNVYATAVDEPRRVANHGTASEVLAFNRAALRSKLPLTGTVDATTAIGVLMPAGNDAGQYGFDVGFLQYLLPPSLNAPPDASPFATPYFTADATRLLDATYALTEEPYLADARQGFANSQGAGPVAAARLRETIDGRLLEEPLVAQQLRYYLHAAALYSVGVPGGTRYAGFGPEQYDRLLAWAAYAVMANQSNSFNALAAYATQDVDRGRRHARANAVWGTYLFMYLQGVLDNRHQGKTLEQALPLFTTR
jgi:hypothetical protein